MLWRTTEGEAVENVIGDRSAGPLVIAHRREPADGFEHLGRHLDGRIEVGDDGKIHRHFGAGAGTGALAILVDDAHGAEDDADIVRIATRRSRPCGDVGAHSRGPSPGWPSRRS